MNEVTSQRVAEALQTVVDPEVGINVIDLGLVYGITVAERDVRIFMTMTSQACPLDSYFSQSVERSIRTKIPEVMDLRVEMIWKPEWNPAMMSQDARRLMGWRT